MQFTVIPFPALLPDMQCVLAIVMSKQFKGVNASNFLAERIHRVALLDERSPKQDTLLLYLCVALSRSDQPLKLQQLGAKTTTAIVAAARSRMQDARLQVGFCGAKSAKHACVFVKRAKSRP